MYERTSLKTKTKKIGNTGTKTAIEQLHEKKNNNNLQMYGK